MPVGEDLGGERGQNVPFGPEVVVDDVEVDAEAARVGAVDQRLELLGRAVRGLRGERKHAVVAPVARAGRLRERHQLDRGDAELDQRVEPRERAGIRPFGTERPDVQLVDDDLVPRAAVPRRLPGVRRGVDDRARRVDAVGLEARGGVGNRAVEAGEGERVARAGPGAFDARGKPAALAARQRVLGAVDEDDAARPRRCPDAKVDAAGAQLGAERHRMHVLHAHSARRAASAGPSAPGRRTSASRTSRSAPRMRKKAIAASRCAGSCGRVGRSLALAA